MKARFEEDELGEAIASVDAPPARDAFRSGLRSALLTAAASEWSEPRPAPRPTLSWAPRFAVSLAVIVAVAFGATGAAAASSLPGDTTYPVKLAFEQVEFALALDDAARVEVLTRQADRRLDELNRVAEQRPQSAPMASASYQVTVEKFQAAVDALRAAPADEKHDRALEVADAAAQKHVEVLEAIQRRSDAPGIEKALEQARELGRHTKDTDKKRDDKGKDDDRNLAPSAPSASPLSATPRPTPTVRPTARPTETAKPTETARPTETPKPTGGD